MIICAILILFIVLKYTVNPYVYIGIIIFSLTGLVISTLTDLYLVIGTNSSIVYDGTATVGVITQPLIYSLSGYNYIFQVFYIMAMIGSIMYWSIDNPREKDDWN